MNECSQCVECRKHRWRWRDCPGELAWYSFQVFCFCPNMTRWAFKNYRVLSEYMWPAEGRESPGRQPIGHNAKFENTAAIMAVLNPRIDKIRKDKTGEDDMFLTMQNLTDNWPIDDMAKLRKTRVDIIETRINSVVYYCSGARIKGLSYKEFRQHRRTPNIAKGQIAIAR